MIAISSTRLDRRASASLPEEYCSSAAVGRVLSDQLTICDRDTRLRTSLLYRFQELVQDGANRVR
jgi:hypothetical protein